MGSVKRFDIQRRVVSHMTSKSWMNVPHVVYLYEPDVTDFDQEYQALSNEEALNGRKLSFNTVMLRVIVEGLIAAPDLNAIISYHHKRGEGTLEICDNINICVPWLLPDGRMITPVISDAKSITLSALAESISELEKKISNTNVDELLYKAALSDTINELKRFNLGIFRRIFASLLGPHRIKGLSGKEKEEYYSIPQADRLSEQNLISGTVTISNIGALYKQQKGCFGLLEIVPPQVFAVGLGAMQEKPGVYTESDGTKTIGIRKFLPMCLVFDHRGIDFISLIPFLKTLDHIFLEPGAIHNW